VKRELPLFVTAAVGLFMILSFFVPHQVVSVPADFLQQSAIIVVAFGIVLGGANLLRVNLEGVARRQPGWPYKLVLVVGLVVTVALGLIEGRDFQAAGTRSTWVYDQIYSSMSSAMFALLAFFIASAAFRAFRIRTAEAALLALAAFIIMMGRVPLGGVLTAGLPRALRIESWAQWILDVPQNAANRAILIGAALGVMATGLRVILGIERSYLSGED
jgi:uncharacterized membrane protein YhaH (DUF805 family)